MAMQLGRAGACWLGRFSALASKRASVPMFVRPYAMSVLASRSFATSSFIHQVMSQVKKEMEVNEELRESIMEIHESSLLKRAKDFAQLIKRARSTSAEQASSLQVLLAQQYARFFAHTSDSVYLKWLARHFSLCHKYTVLLMSDRVSKFIEIFAENKKTDIQEHLKRWKEQQEVLHPKSETSSPNTETDSSQDALVLTKQSVWERFGAQLHEMPFLNHLFTEGIVSNFFGETAQAAAIREMKSMDPQFKLSHLEDLVEYLICYHILHCFLVADEKALKLHCGEALFSMMQKSTLERRHSHIELDPSILIVRNVEFQRSPEDVREILHSMALRKHPEADTPGNQLEYPWQIMEFAMLQNTPSW